MTLQNLPLTDANNDWLQAQGDPIEVINALISKARAQDAENDWIREQLRKAAASGICEQTPEEILAEIEAEFDAKASAIAAE